MSPERQRRNQTETEHSRIVPPPGFFSLRSLRWRNFSSSTKGALIGLGIGLAIDGYLAINYSIITANTLSKITVAPYVIALALASLGTGYIIGKICSETKNKS